VLSILVIQDSEPILSNESFRFAILDRLMILVILLTLCLGELGVPETFLVKHLSAISMVSTSLWLGLGKIWSVLEASEDI